MKFKNDDHAYPIPPLRVFRPFFLMTLRLLNPLIFVDTIFLLIVITLLAWGIPFWCMLRSICLLPLWFEAARVFDEFEAPEILWRFGKCVVIIPLASLFQVFVWWRVCFPKCWSKTCYIIAISNKSNTVLKYWKITYLESILLKVFKVFEPLFW